jgi:hypothetical protein
MRNVLCLVLLLALPGTAMASKVGRLSDQEYAHYTALKVWMEDHQEKAYLKGKTQEERDTWLKEHGFWDKFYQYGEATRAAIVSGDVQIGFLQDQVQMAWGQPHSRSKLAGRPAVRSELFVYRFEENADGETLVWTPKSRTVHKAVRLYQVDVYIDDSEVTDIVEKDHWE